jgi:uroporphyrinogen decarboxylase
MMTPLERTLATLGHQEPDRVPAFFLLTMHGAKELGMSIEEYFSKGGHVAEGQLKMMEKYGNDCLYSFFYAPVEIEAFGGEVIYWPDGPPNSGRPLIKSPRMIEKLEAPNVNQPCLEKVYTAQRLMNAEVGGRVPIIGVVISPFSLPVMQMGFGPYLDLMVDHPELFRRLMEVNTEFCVNWANAQAEAGVTAICYFDPVSSSEIVAPAHYRETGKEVARETLERIEAPIAAHFASGRSLDIIDDVAQTGAAVIGVSSKEDIGQLKEKARGKISLLGNLNGIEMCRWTEREAEDIVKETIRKAAPGGGFILSDNHGEIPYQVKEETLLAISRAVERYGQYPIQG